MSKAYKQYMYQDARADKDMLKGHRPIKCGMQDHDGQDIILMCANPHCELNRFLCPMCIAQHEACSASLIVISNLAKDDVNIPDARLSREARDMLRHYAEDKKLLEDVDSFYDELRDQLLGGVEMARRETLGYVDRLVRDKGQDLREIIDLVCSSFNFNAIRVLLNDLEEGRLTQADASRRLSLYLTSKEKTQKLKDLNGLLQNGCIPERKLTLQEFGPELKQLEELLLSFKRKVVSFKGQEVVRPSKGKEHAPPFEVTDPALPELAETLKGRKSVV